MSKIIAIGGVPATGKTTLMKAFMKKASDWKYLKPIDLVDGQFSTDLNTFVLGQYQEGEKFGGTDRFSMACQPKAEEMLLNFQEVNGGIMPNIVFEGDRLFNSSYLEFCSEQAFDLKIIILWSHPETVEQRHKDRNDTQSEKFKKGRETKYDNIKGNFLLKPYIDFWNNENQKDLENNTNQLFSMIKS